MSIEYTTAAKLMIEIERLRAEGTKLRAALEALYNQFSLSNDFRPDGKAERQARAALNEETE